MKEEGYEVVLVNSNSATVMTDTTIGYSASVKSQQESVIESVEKSMYFLTFLLYNKFN